MQMGKVIRSEYIKDSEQKLLRNEAPPKHFTINTKKHAEGETSDGQLSAE